MNAAALQHFVVDTMVVVLTMSVWIALCLLQAISWLVSNYLVQDHPIIGPEWCLIKEQMYYLIGTAYTVSIIRGFLSFVVSKKTTLVSSSASLHSTRDVTKCEAVGCLCWTSAADSNSVLLRNRIGLLSLLELLLFPLWIQFIENRTYVLSLIGISCLVLLSLLTSMSTFVLSGKLGLRLVHGFLALVALSVHGLLLGVAVCSYRHR